MDICARGGCRHRRHSLARLGRAPRARRIRTFVWAKGCKGDAAEVVAGVGAALSSVVVYYRWG